MRERQDPYDNNVSDTVRSLMDEHAEVTEPKTDPRSGQRGTRRRPRYRSEAKRQKLTLDIDLEPAVADVLRVLAENEAGTICGDGPLRAGDLGTTALVIGLLDIAGGEADIEADWTARSRGQRSVSFSEGLEEKWWTLIRALKIDV